MLFTLKKVIGNMLLPLPLMLLIIGAGLALLWFSRFQKTGKIFISIGWLALLLLSLQPVADRLLRPIESTYPTWNNSQKVDYIVVLGGGYTWNPQWAPSSKEGANKQVISSQADSLIKISRIWADFFPANTSNQPI
ncbi:inner membrane protein [Escherichia coli]|nr:inner membrane protein [Escherichia coli]STK00357.1 inner membrane protein [Escherichia coli]